MTATGIIFRPVAPVEDAPLETTLAANAWTAAMSHLGAAHVAQASMRSHHVTRQMRDEATVRFARELEQLFEAMTVLCATGGAGMITNLLCKEGA